MSERNALGEQDSARDEEPLTVRRGQARFTNEELARRQAENEPEQGLFVSEADQAPDDSAPEGVFGPSDDVFAPSDDARSRK